MRKNIVLVMSLVFGSVLMLGVHNIAWRTRNNLHLDFAPAGVSGDATHKDNIVYDITSQPGQMPGVSAGGWGHPHCVNPVTESAIAAALPPTE